MKRFSKTFISIATLGMLFSIAGCGSSETPMSDFERKTRDIYESGLREGSIQDQTYEEWLISIRGQDGKDGHTPDIKIGDNGNWFIDGVDTGIRAQGPQGEPGQDGNPGKDGENGKPGQDGVSVVSILKTGTSEDGLVDTYTITYSNGNTSTFTVTNGKDGKNGQDGQSIQGNPGKDGHTPVITISEDGYWVIDDNKTNQKAQGEIGPEGPQGPQGEPGADGTSVLTGHGVPNNDAGKDGDSYINLDNWDFYVRDSGVWTKQGNIKGEQGIPGTDGSNGTDGTNGSDGKSAYELYCDAHPDYTGTEEEWLDEIMSNRSITMSGKAGENINWKLYNDGKLEFDGEGAMRDYIESNWYIMGTLLTPWHCFGPCVTEAIFDDGITYLCNFGLYEMSSIEHIRLPDSLQQIGFCAFEYCSSLKELSIPDNVYLQGKSLFQGCLNIESITLPNTMTVVDEYEFAQCKSLPSIKIPDSVTQIWQYAFNDCESLKSIDLPANLQTLGQFVFHNCKSLPSITLPSGTQAIGYRCFEDCDSLNDPIIPETVTSIDHAAFANCDSLETITLPDSLITLGNAIFENCCRLSTVNLSNNLVSISEGCFGGCTMLPTITIPDSVVTLEASAFVYCSSLNNITIPKSVTLIDQYCFSGCSSLTNLSYEGTMEEWNTVEKNGGWRKDTPLTVVHCSDGDVELD